MKRAILAALGLAGAALCSGAPAQAEPARVHVGAYVNDIQALDLRTHSYVVDLYVWFRWTDPAIDPGESFEFMNLFDPEAHIEEKTYEAPIDQPDGSKYQVVRHQGAFSTKFDVRRYPFDSQELRVAIEDADRTSDDLVYVLDEVKINPDITLPGYTLGAPRLDIADKPYPTNFGDLNDPEIAPYSRATIFIPITRPSLSGAVKTLLPVVLIMLCAVAALLLTPKRVEARVGLTITALLTLVALQFSMSGGLPEVGYLLMLDQIYITSYAAVLAVVALIVGSAQRYEKAEARGEGGQALADHKGGRMAALVAALYGLAIAGVLMLNLGMG